MNKSFKELIFLACSVGIFVPIWGVFHANIGIKAGWPAFVSAAFFFAMGHKSSDIPKVLIGLLLGICWGMLFFALPHQPLLQFQNHQWTMLVVLSLLGIASVIITSSKAEVFSHLPSLFCGWAITVAILANVPIDNWTRNAFDLYLSLVGGVLFLGVGISGTNSLLLKFFTNPKSDGKKSPKEKVVFEEKNEYLASFSSNKGHEEKIVNEDAYQKQLNEINRNIKEISMSLDKNSSNYSTTPVNIVGICGSHHKNSSTVVYLQRALKAAESMGNVTTQLITLAHQNIKPCLACKTDKCHRECIIKDDYMKQIYPILLNADGIIIGSPSYFGTMTGQLKNFLDRLRVMRHTDFQLANKVVGALSVAGRRHGGQEITNLDIIQAMMRHNTIIVNDGTTVCQLGATGWAHVFDDPNAKVEDDVYGLQTCDGVGIKVTEIAKAIKSSGLQTRHYKYNASVGKR